MQSQCIYSSSFLGVSSSTSSSLVSVASFSSSSSSSSSSYDFEIKKLKIIFLNLQPFYFTRLILCYFMIINLLWSVVLYDNVLIIKNNWTIFYVINRVESLK